MRGIYSYYLLEEFLYEAIFQRDANNLLPESIIFDPDIYIYIEDFGSKKDDYCLCSECENKIIGAVWVKIIDGFGSIDNETRFNIINENKQEDIMEYKFS